MAPDNNEWSEYSRLVLAELSRLSKCFDEIEKKHNSFILKTSIDVGKLKIYAAISGAISGTLATVVVKIILERWAS